MAKEKTGLACLSDDALAAIVEAEVRDDGELCSTEGKAAFNELASRS